VLPEIAREICQRTGSAAFIESSLANDGSGFLVALRARNCATGDLVEEEQARASGKDDVLTQLRRLTARLKSKSASSVTVLQKNAAALESATTSSLEALKSFTAAMQQLVHTSEPDAVQLFKRAIEIDPQFALAYAELGRSYADSGEQTLAAESIRQAYLLRDMVSDKENYYITYSYNREVLRNFEMCRQICESWIAKYPGEMQPHAFLSGLTSKGAGQYEKSIAEGEKALAFDPDFSVGYENIAEAYLFLNRREEMRATLQRAAQRKRMSKNGFSLQFLDAFSNGTGAQ
jgi:tetratricopeptide (TPR) repeat protein